MSESIRRLLSEFDSSLEVVETWEAYVLEKPQSKQSTRFGRRGAYTSPKKKAYIDALVHQLEIDLGGKKVSGNLRVTLLFCFSWRIVDKVWPVDGWALMDKIPDVDNLLKPLFDALTKVIEIDDCKIVEVRARKIRFTVPCIAIKLEKIIEKYRV